VAEEAGGGGRRRWVAVVTSHSHSHTLAMRRQRAVRERLRMQRWGRRQVGGPVGQRVCGGRRADVVWRECAG